MKKIIDVVSAELMAEMFLRPSLFTRPNRKTVMTKSLKDMGFSADEYRKWETEPFTVRSGDIEIPAEYHPVRDHKGIAVMCHGFGQNRYIMIPQAEILRKEGYSVIMYDQRHFGVSKAPYCSFGFHESDDLIALIDWAKNKAGNDTRIVVLGVSMGAMTLMSALGKTGLIDAGIADCGPAKIDDIYEPFMKAVLKKPNPYIRGKYIRKAAKAGFDATLVRPIDGVRNSDTPLLVIQSEGDSLVSVETAKEIRSASRNVHSDIRIFPDVEHALSITFFEEYSAAVRDFLIDVFGA